MSNAWDETVRPRFFSIPVTRWRGWLRLALGTALAAAAFSAAQAQEQGASSSSTSASASAPLQQVVVTGSRIERAKDLQSSSPLVTVSSDSLQNISTVGIEAALNQFPQFVASETQYVTGDVQPSAVDSPGISTVDLRGLGDNRTLVLVDGRRAQPSNATLVVDVNSIPEAAIDSIEVVTGGASAVYGADAVAGVVNFKLKDHFQGFQVDAQSGETQYGDGAESRISTLMGTNFADDKGNVMVVLEWSKRDAVNETSRPFFVNGLEDPGSGAAELITFRDYNPGSNVPAQSVVNSLYPGITGVGNDTPFYFNTDGTLFKDTDVPGNAAATTAGFDSALPPYTKSLTNEDGALDQQETDDAWVSSPMTRYSMFARARYNLTDTLSAFFQGNFESYDVLSLNAYVPATAIWSAMIPYSTDPTSLIRQEYPVPTELATLLDARPDPNAPWEMESDLNYLGPRELDNHSSIYQAMVGLDGILPFHDWTWELYASHGETTVLSNMDNGYASEQEYLSVVESPYYGKGYTAASPGGSATGFTASCTTGLPVFSNFVPSQDCLNAIEIDMKNLTTVSQNIVEWDSQGRLFDLWAGGVRGSLGADFRQDSASYSPDALGNGFSTYEQPVGVFSSAAASGTTSVKEVYAELLIPVLKDLPAIKSMNIEAGERYSDYNTAGTTWTDKLLLNWAVNDYISFRGGTQFAVRAPNVAELYVGNTENVVSFPFSDPCAATTTAIWGNIAADPNRAKVQALCAQLISKFDPTSPYFSNPNTWVGGNGGFFPFEIETIQGNPDVKPEQAHTLTVGTVLRSPFDSAELRNATATIDFYNITLDNAIEPLSAVTVYENCFNANGTSNPTYSINNPFCQDIRRDTTTGGRAATIAPYYNLGFIKTDGLDFTLNWRTPLGGIPGQLALSVSGTWLMSFKEQPTPGGPVYQYAGTAGETGAEAYFTWRTFTTLEYLVGPAMVGLTWEHLPSIENSAIATDPTLDVLTTPKYDLVSLISSYDVTSNVSLRFGVDNLLNTEPPIYGAEPGVTDASGTTLPGVYDTLGRRFYLGVKATL